MIFWIINLSLSFLLCVFLAGIVIPQILLIAFRKRLFDEPDGRKIHHQPVPRLGGMAFKPVVFLCIALLLGISLALGRPEIAAGMGSEARPLAFGFCSIMLLYMVGIADDLIGVRYSAKFAAQILCAMMIIAGGVRLDDLHGLLGIHALPLWAGCPLTVLVTVFIINSVNLIDGIDGLASGLCSMAFLFYGVVFCLLHNYIYAMLSFATLGVLVPFFCYNVFGNADHGRKIFMGDTGSLTTGMMLTFLGLRLAACMAGADGMQGPNPMVAAFAPLLVPCLDVVRVYLHRVRSGVNPFLPDRNHIHHKLLALGMGQVAAMVSIVAFSCLLTVCNVLLSRSVDINWLLLADVLVWTVANIWITRRISRAQPGMQATEK